MTDHKAIDTDQQTHITMNIHTGKIVNFNTTRMNQSNEHQKYQLTTT